MALIGPPSTKFVSFCGDLIQYFAKMSSPKFTLYHNPYSVCSIMVRQTIAIRGEAKSADLEVPITEQVVDIFNEEQLSEHFLCEINPLGQV
jgi:hypothetical protein